MSSSIGVTFLGALQASLSVLLTIFYGVIAGQFNLLKQSSSEDISNFCVNMLLPALLITRVGSELEVDTVGRYAPVVIWGLVYTFSSMLIGLAFRKFFKQPAWIVPAVMFNNTTSYPLILVKSLSTAGILEGLLKSKSDSLSAAVGRAESYFLVNAVVSNCLTFALGPMLLDARDDSDGDSDLEADQDNDREHEDDEQNGDAQNGAADETTSLLPDAVVKRGRKINHGAKDRHENLPDWLRKPLEFTYGFINAPLIGAIIGLVIGLAPPLHFVFFGPSQEGAIFKAWLTSSLKNVGELFAALQVIIVGVKLSSCLRKMKRGEESGEVGLIPLSLAVVVRFILWPVISIAVIYFVARHTNALSDDPILWFCLMLMPCGPSAMILTALADVNSSPEKEKLTIAKLLTMMYSISPLVSFAVVGALKTSQMIAEDVL